MSQYLLGLGFSLMTAIVVLAGDVILKVAADGKHPILSATVLVGCALYAASAIFWLTSLRHVSLAQAGVAYSMLTLLALCVIGVIWFGEQLGWREFMGIGCALAAMVLMVRVT